MAGRRIIITNNPLVQNLFINKNLEHRYSLYWISGYTEHVLASTRNFCHRSHLLITHPLTGSIKPNQTPYKTVIVEKMTEDSIDEQSIWISEFSYHTATKLLKSHPRSSISPSLLGDFATLDLSFFTSYLESVTH